MLTQHIALKAAPAAGGEVIERATQAELAMDICLPGRVAQHGLGPSQGPLASMVPGRAQDSALLKGLLESSLTQSCHVNI